MTRTDWARMSWYARWRYLQHGELVFADDARHIAGRRWIAATQYGHDYGHNDGPRDDTPADPSVPVTPDTAANIRRRRLVLARDYR